MGYIRILLRHWYWIIPITVWLLFFYWDTYFTPVEDVFVVAVECIWVILGLVLSFIALFQTLEDI